MSRIGKKAIVVPKGVTVNVSGQTVSAKGPERRIEIRRQRSLHCRA